ncbi:MAG TPA: DsbA family protein [Woeseiaceae bacterium]
MSRKDRSQQSNTQTRNSLVAAAVGVLVLVALAATFLYPRDETPSAQTGVDERSAALESALSPTIGPPNAKVHIVEFLDPACETCAMFYPMVKNWMKEVPDQIRLTVRHVAFHAGSEHAVKVLEASRKQDKYWQTLEALLASQQQWVQNHTVMPDRILPAIASVGLDVAQLEADMNSVEVMQRMEKDKKDSIVLKVAATPEYFVNGRPLPSFGQQQLANLVREELQK